MKHTAPTALLPSYSRDDAWKILCFHDRSNGAALDSASTQVLLEIERTLSRLQATGDDNRRALWIRAHDRGKDPGWFHMTSGHHGERHYLILSDGQFHYSYVRSWETGFLRGEETHYDLCEALSTLSNHLKGLVEWICEDPSGYNAYVERYLPYKLREGDIPARTLEELTGEALYEVKERDEKISALEKMKLSSPTVYDRKTLRTYIGAWAQAYRTVKEFNRELHQDNYGRAVLEECHTLDDVSLFREYNSKGKETEGLDMDSEEDFLKWEKENSPYHSMDITYARIHLDFTSVHSELERRKAPPFNLCISFSVTGYWQDVLEIALSLYGEGTTVVLYEMDDIMRLLRGDYLVGFRPWPDKYMIRRGVTAQTTLPQVSSVGRDTYWKIVRATSWHKEIAALPRKQEEGEEGGEGECCKCESKDLQIN